MNNNKTNELLKEILKWQKIQGMEILKKKIKEEDLFSNKNQIVAYYHSNGKKSSREIEKITSIGYKKIQELWKKWISAGIAELSEEYKRGRCKRSFELNELGLELPKLKAKRIKRDK